MQVQWPTEIVHRIRRVLEYHQASKLTSASERELAVSSPRPDPFRTFPDAPKIALPTNLISADTAVLPLLDSGLDAVPQSQVNPPHDLRTLATWLFLADGLVKRARQGKRVDICRTCPSAADTFPCEIYVAAFSVEQLEPGLYHYSPREFALRKLRDGLATLAHLKRGRPDLESLKTCPAVVLVSTIFCRSTWRFGRRGYRTALTDAGHLIENLVLAGTALGMRISARLHLSDSAARELIGVPQDVQFDQAEAVQAMVAWTDPVPQPAYAAQQQATMPPIPRAPLAAGIAAYDLVPLVHQDCVAPGVAIREVRPPLTELTPLPPTAPAYERESVEQPPGGKGLGPVAMSSRPVGLFHRRSIPRDTFLAMNKLAFRGPCYYPMAPAAPHAALVRPFWFIHDVTGMDAGVWYYHPPSDKWTMMARGSFRIQAAHISGDHRAAADASAVCVLVADLHQLAASAGPDTYRLAHLEAGIIAQRFHLMSAAVDLGASSHAAFYDDELRKGLGLDQTGWEVVYEVMIGVPVDEDNPDVPDLVEDEDLDWRG